jgi:hypothetical protein
VYVCTGFLVPEVALSPNDQFHKVGEFVETSVKVTVNGAVPDVGVPVKLASGAGGAGVTVIYPIFSLTSNP